MNMVRALLPALFVPVTAVGSEGIVAEIQWPLINFAIYVAIVVYVYRRKVLPLLQARRLQIETELSRAARNLMEVEGELSRVREQLERHPEERREMLRVFEEESRRLAQAERRTGDDEAQRIERQAEEQVATALRQLEKELRIELIRRATEGATVRLRENLSADDDRLLRNTVIHRLSSNR